MRWRLSIALVALFGLILPLSASAEEAEAELVRPVFGVKVANRTIDKHHKYEKYTLVDYLGRKWPRHRRVPNGESVTLYVHVTAVDLPKRVMGTTATLVFPLAAETTKTVFPLSSIPLRPGKVHREKMKIYISQDQIKREQGNWLRKVKLDDLSRNIFVRPGAVRFMDGTRHVYREEPTVPTESDVDWEELDRLEQRPARKKKTSGAKPKRRRIQFGFIPGKRSIRTTVPLHGGRVFVRSYFRKDGTFVRSHTRSRPRRK